MALPRIVHCGADDFSDTIIVGMVNTMSTYYQNPVYPFDFADPFVLRTRGAYFAYGTAAAGADGLIFPVLRSSNLANWEPLGGALKPLTDPPAYSYWAPEVAEKDRSILYVLFSVDGTVR